MFKVKRPAIIGLLLILLIFTGYLNYQFTQQALRKTSQEYQEYEMAEMEKYLGTQEEEEGQKAEAEDDEIQIVDSEEVTDEDIKEVIAAGKQDLVEQMEKEVSSHSRNYFVEQRLSRDKLRANLIDRLNDIVNNDNTTEAMRTEAQQEIMNIGKLSEKELTIEGLIKSKGFDEALVLLTDSDIKVIVDTPELNELEMVKILDIVRAETDFDMDSIKIIKKQ
ncbi:MAG: SpoIIIAH-like family protein [Tissierellia bacterium]|nr:SpoIIIAH-like family protein [Tissierellia bacterium]